jgi:hypothetical protein
MSLYGLPRIVAGLFGSLALGMTLAGCTDPQGPGDRLSRELPQVYPSQITAIQFENSPPLDPPTLFIDLVPSMTPDQQLRFVCDEVLPRVRAASDSIAVASGPYGWNDDDCE